MCTTRLPRSSIESFVRGIRRSALLPASVISFRNSLDFNLSPSPSCFALNPLKMSTPSFEIPKECKAGVVVDEGPNFRVEVKTVPVPEIGIVPLTLPFLVQRRQ